MKQSDLSDNQKSFVRKYELDNLLNIHPHLMIPIPILQWAMYHLNCNGTGVFRKGDKIIHLRRHMVIQVFGIRSGSVPFPLDSTDQLLWLECYNLGLSISVMARRTFNLIILSLS